MYKYLMKLVPENNNVGCEVQLVADCEGFDRNGDPATLPKDSTGRVAGSKNNPITIQVNGYSDEMMFFTTYEIDKMVQVLYSDTSVKDISEWSNYVGQGV